MEEELAVTASASRASEQEEERAVAARAPRCRRLVHRGRCVCRHAVTEEERAVTARASLASEQEEERAVAARAPRCGRSVRRGRRVCWRAATEEELAVTARASRASELEEDRAVAARASRRGDWHSAHRSRSATVLCARPTARITKPGWRRRDWGAVGVAVQMDYDWRAHFVWFSQSGGMIGS
eukprot:1963753-Rhodomonas_salina.2